MVDAIRATRYTYDAVGQLLSEDGPWNDDTVSYTYANRLRSGLSVQAPNASPWSQTYAYDGAKRLTNATSPAGEFGYLYDTTRKMLVATNSLPTGGKIKNTYDSSARLTETRLWNSSSADLDYHSYTYNTANQRTEHVFLNANYTDYTYDKIGQLKSAIGNGPEGQRRPHERFGYAYDAAGNLNWRTNDAFLQKFEVNSLNELTTNTRSGNFTVAGTTTGPATNVTVNTLAADFFWEDNTFARTNVSLSDGNNTFTAIAKDVYGRSDTNSSLCFLPATNLFLYDLNGNLLSDGHRGFDYDDENELIRITVTNAWKSEFSYDGKLRRRIRKEFTWLSAISNWQLTNEVHYVYDGLLPIQERDANNLPSVTYTRGPDLSGTLEAAGGIGGLLARTDMGLWALGFGLGIGSSLSAHAYYFADGHGNITVLIDTNQIVVAKYLYDPFGNMQSAAGPLAEANLYRFSSKEAHTSSGMYYYGYRFYAPSSQRWINRDPIEELGGNNLHGFVGNNPINRRDPLGLLTAECEAARQALADALRNRDVAPGPLTQAAVAAAVAAEAAACGRDPKNDGYLDVPLPKPIPLPKCKPIFDPTRPLPEPPNNQGNFCQRHPAICAGGAVVATGVIVGAIIILTGGTATPVLVGAAVAL